MPADIQLVRRLAGATHRAVIATTRTDGTVHASLVSAGVFDEPPSDSRGPVVAAVIHGAARKLSYMRGNGRAATVFTQGFEWVTVEGPVRLIGPDDPDDAVPAGEIPDLLRRIFVAAGGTHDDWDEYDRVMAAERRTAVLITPERITSNG